MAKEKPKIYLMVHGTLVHLTGGQPKDPFTVEITQIIYDKRKKQKDNIW